MPTEVLRIKDQLFDFKSRTYIMGVLNVTPDSFSDGGKFYSFEAALEQGLKMASEGADIIDIGGESTRPGSESVSLEEELSRVIPVIKELSQRTNLAISIDTYKAEVARQALDAGAHLINDISGLRFDPEMQKIASAYQVPLILMHIQGVPRNMQENPVYKDVIKEICEYLQENINLALKAGVKEENIIIDPGIGFGKTFEHNLTILKNLTKFKVLNKPILIGVSRKSFIGKILDLPVEERLEGSLAALAYAILQGANIVRVHDVKESMRVAGVIEALKNSKI